MASWRQLHTMAAMEIAVQAAMTAQRSACEMPRSVKVRDLAKNVEARIDFRACKLLQALGAETLAGIRAHHAAVKHGVPPGGRRECFLGSKITEESAGKTVARAGGVDDLFERERRSFEGAKLRFLAFWSRFVE